MTGNVKGVSEMVAKLRRIATKTPERVGRAMFQEGQIEMTEAKRRTPVDVTPPAPHPGQLRASGTVHPPEREGRNIIVVLSFGGAAESYAIYVHEILENHHEVGQAKFLESVLNESRPHMAARIGKRVHFEHGDEKADLMFLDHIAARLVAQAVGQLNVNIFISSKAIIPAGAGPHLTLSDTGGSAPTRIQNQASAATQRPTAQIAVRALSYSAAMTMSRSAYTALDGVFNTSLAGTFYLSITARQEPTDTGAVDGAGRVVLVFNIDAEKYAA